MKDLEKDPHKMAVEGILKTDILLEFLEAMELPPMQIIEGIREAGNRVIESQHEDLQEEERFKILMASMCAELTAMLVGNRMDLSEIKALVSDALARKLAEELQPETNTYQ